MGGWRLFKSPPQGFAFFLQDIGTALLLLGQCLWGFASLPPPLPCGLPAPADNFGVQHDDWANNHSCITHVATGDVARGKKRSATMIVAAIVDLGLIKLGMQCLVNIADLIFALYNWGVVFIIGCCFSWDSDENWQHCTVEDGLCRSRAEQIPREKGSVSSQFS